MKYKLSTISWFKIKDGGYLPFIVNTDKTKIKLLTENVVLPLKPVYSDDRIPLAKVRNGTSFESQCMYAIEDYLVDKKGFVIPNAEEMFYTYYLEKNLFQKIKFCFEENENEQKRIKSKIYNKLWLDEPQIKKLTNEINKNYKNVADRLKNKAEREERKREKDREKARRDREKTEEKINETKNF